MTTDAAIDPRPAVLRALADLESCPPCDDEQMRAVVIGVALGSEMGDEDE